MSAVHVEQPQRMGVAEATRRQAMIAKVHIAKKELRLDDAAYGDVLTRVTGEGSARTLSTAQLEAVLAEFKRLGWVAGYAGATSKSGASAASVKSTRGRFGGAGKLSQKAQVRMIYGVWKDLRPHLASGGTPEALRAFVARQTRSRTHPEGVAAPEFLDSKQANLVLEGLKAWLARVRRETAAVPGAGVGDDAR